MRKNISCLCFQAHIRDMHAEFGNVESSKGRILVHFPLSTKASQCSLVSPSDDTSVEYNVRLWVNGVYAPCWCRFASGLFLDSPVGGIIEWTFEGYPATTGVYSIIPPTGDWIFCLSSTLARWAVWDKEITPYRHDNQAHILSIDKVGLKAYCKPWRYR